MLAVSRGGGKMGELGQQRVPLSTLVGRAAEEAYSSLKELVEKARTGEQSDTEKKIDLLKYIVKTQQRMLRLNVAAKWCQQVCCCYWFCFFLDFNFVNLGRSSALGSVLNG